MRRSWWAKYVDGVKHEPFEQLVIDVPEGNAGKATELVMMRKGMLLVMEAKGDLQHMEFRIPSRGLIGLRNQILTATAGEAVALALAAARQQRTVWNARGGASGGPPSRELRVYLALAVAAAARGRRGGAARWAVAGLGRAAEREVAISRGGGGGGGGGAVP